ncbi:hypothetical protein FD04_GL001891 [Secundilactobacillus odoratitofui DSM 19909 = JCM 15043]|uniref:Uncharacterized protein n=1 Tax=Secundilactobacillus odoratitofui DSM 19909 = JCM 15043 TaxID=1423776 RepID=A0A0R1LND8_9LACO|nr:hypothetical protein FD04_GL001891 [Secundilactobacillus odoratitofui DSM 19909 = JCM 15043]
MYTNKTIRYFTFTVSIKEKSNGVSVMFYTESFFQLALEIINLNHDFRSTFETHPAIL